MKIRSTIGRWVDRADRLNDWRRHHVQQRRPPGPLEIVPYLGYGTAQRLMLSGRVLRLVAHRAPQAADPAWRNLVAVYRRMASGEVPGARVRAVLGEQALEAEADGEGHFEMTFEPAQPLDKPLWQEVGLELLWPVAAGALPVTATARVLVPPPTARLAVVSDLDDTVVWSNVRHRLRMLSLLLRSNAYTRKPFAGVSALYRALHRGASGAQGNPVFYVSSSPWNLYTPLRDFLRLQGLPEGPLLLKDFGDHLLFGPLDHVSHKLRHIEQLLAAYPALPFVLIGDSGEQDPEIYARVVQVHPGRVCAVYIRSVDPDPARHAAVARLAEEAAAAGVPLRLVADSVAVAEHAAQAGWVSPSAVDDVRADRREEATARVA
ncbi:App1 family protein [Azohydromonas lata]|uniref:Phosphatase domain-containing protein n=1 Tax=Azohydromonas lata TaxID=45677 RepID=A0ABU5IHD9_9BURK|nr:phosphatase domain-containing protein [Azohydromonas lata]MDZ5458563.1 phosphatase domain-containing protein [Azohydromonas lata]